MSPRYAPRPAQSLTAQLPARRCLRPALPTPCASVAASVPTRAHSMHSAAVPLLAPALATDCPPSALHSSRGHHLWLLHRCSDALPLEHKPPAQMLTSASTLLVAGMTGMEGAPRLVGPAPGAGHAHAQSCATGVAAGTAGMKIGRLAGVLCA